MIKLRFSSSGIGDSLAAVRIVQIGLLLLGLKLPPACLNIYAATAFTQVTQGDIANDVGNAHGVAWGDFNNDGLQDIFVANVPGNNFLYRNLGDGTFAKVTDGAIVSDGGSSTACAWADYDNDGHLDLFVSNTGQASFLYHNRGDGTFERVGAGDISTVAGGSYGCAWGDYDKDGFVDLFVADLNGKNFLFRNTGQGTFLKVSDGDISNDIGNSVGCAWGDYDNDGDIDLFVANGGINTDFLYRNGGSGLFQKITSGAAVTTAGASSGCAWGDYDNNGFLDLFVANRNGRNFLYRNDGGSNLVAVTQGEIANEAANANGCAWGDYDNDGFLDVFVANWEGVRSVLYRNNGDGSFSKITTNSGVNNFGTSTGAAWADYNNDGFLDLFVGNWNNQRNFLYRNNGGTNNWIKVSLKSLVSNRSAIGAKVRIRATINGTNRWLLREISGGDSFGSQSSLVAHFGLGNAAAVETVKVEWPSGGVQEINNAAPNQTLTITEQSIPVPVISIIPGGGLFTNSVKVRITTTIGIAEIRYTLDNATPTTNSFLYTNEFSVDAAAILQARVFVNGFPVSEPFVATFARVYALDDGIPNVWRQEYFGAGYLTDPRVALDADPDQDGANNLQEYIVGSDPTDPLSGFAVNVRAVPLISWVSISNRTYRVLRKDSLTSTNWSILVPAYFSTNSTSAFVDLDPLGSQTFYVVEPAP